MDSRLFFFDSFNQESFITFGTYTFKFDVRLYSPKKSNDYKIAAFEVIPETLEYHTGYSIDGVDLYTGDLIQDGIDNLIGVIKLGKYCSPFCNNIEECHIGFYVEWLKYDCYLRKDLGYWLSRADIKLIGNIHDNPNLLKEIIE